uniref:PS2 n=1 Tax=Corynebacterium glutamicum TaxID=1718 RepID=Q6QUT0_CORGT|nr:PS2 [Corynebacterium glutamicum]
MFNNRIRTAALAGAIAISTAASGVAIPAFAQETNPTFNITNGFNDADGSTAQPVESVNHTEAELLAATDVTAAYLNDFQNGDVRAIVAELIATSENGFDPSEEAAYQTFEAARQIATQQLAASAETITKTRESVKYALEVDQAATEAFEAYRSALNGAASAINPLIAAANTANRTDKSEVELYDALYAYDLNVTAPELKPAYDELLALQKEVNEDVEWVGEWAIDHGYDDYVTRDHAKAVQALKAAIDAQVEAVKPVRDDAIAKNLLAQKSDVLVRQLFLERATAQRDTLRVVEAIFATATRYVELYESDENVNVEGDTLRNHYVALLPTLFGAASFNVGVLDTADDAAIDFYLVWDTDLATNDEDAAYAEEKRQFALLTYAKVFINGIWQEEVKYVQNLDEGARAEAARIEAERLADEAYRAEQLRIAQEAADAQKTIAEALAKEAEGNNDNSSDNSSDDKETGSSDIGSWGPFAAIAAIIAAIAAIFPFLSGIVKF